MFAASRVQFEFLTGGLAIAHRFLCVGEEYARCGSDAFKSSMNVMSNQVMHCVASESMDMLCKGLAKDLWEVRDLCVGLCPAVPPCRVLTRCAGYPLCAARAHCG